MGRIRQMDDRLATLIAAGEVVTGPVSVVRELVDNALDAGARVIDVGIEEGGLRSVRVADDGAGMDEHDAVLCLSRHATSKIAAVEDLGSIRTLGFRGEALAAILAVSQMRIETRRADDVVGSSVRAAGGTVEEVRPTARRAGTTVEVAHLFYNTPARREFQDTPRAEAGRVLHAVQRIAVARPEVRFTYRDGEREVLALPGTESLLERVRQVHGDDFAEALIPVFGERGEVVVSGFVVHPGSAARRARRNTFIVNGRPFESFEIRRLLTTTFAPLLSPGQHVEAVLAIDLPSADVDVNVSPDKSQVRFRRAGQVLAAVSDALRFALGQEESVARVSTGPRAVPSTPADVSARIAALRRVESELQVRPDAWETLFGGQASGAGAGAAERGVDAIRAVPGSREEPRHGIPREPVVVMQVSNTFLACTVEGGMLLVDQHSAHERVNYERLRARFEQSGRNPDVQPLMFPEALHLDASRMALLEEMLPFLERMGFELTPAGPRQMLVQAVPAALGERSVVRAIEALAEAYSDSRASGIRSGEVGEEITPLEDRLLKTVACHAAVKAGQPLSEAEIRALWKELVEVDLACHDVHGRPGALLLPASEIARRMGRV